MGADAKRKEARKRKFGVETTNEHVSTVGEAGHESPRKKIKAGEPLAHPSISTSVMLESESVGVPTEDDPDKHTQDTATRKAQRFIVFIGNLPYTTTDESIKKHFIKVHPKSIRHRTEKEGSRSKGFAFLEFEGYDRLKTCLKLYHHSSFDDGLSPARKINVELTAGGGGGKSQDRRSKLRAKNDRLNEQRKRRLEEEEKQGAKGRNKVSVEGKIGVKNESTINDKTDGAISVDNGEIHPSRRSRIPTTAHDKPGD